MGLVLSFGVTMNGQGVEIDAVTKLEEISAERKRPRHDATHVGGGTVAAAEASTAAWEAGVAAVTAAVLREAEAAKVNVDRPLSTSTTTVNDVAVTEPLPDLRMG
jgi:hypothetical protein